MRGELALRVRPRSLIGESSYASTRIKIRSQRAAILLLSRMPLSPVAQHLIGNLVGIANRSRATSLCLVSALARTTIRIFCLILAHAPAAITRLALLHDPLPDPIVREALECFRVCTRQTRVYQWCLSIER